MKDKSHKRHIAKSITWRIVGTVDTMLLSWIISGSALVGVKIGFAEVLTKMFLYYFHERAWFKVNFSKCCNHNQSRKRHVLKTVTWRIVGTIDTVLLAWIISGDSIIGFKIGAAEVSTKMILYYLHERAWYRFNYGLEDLKKN